MAIPQGGIKPGETPEQAMYRELQEETGLLPQHVKILGRTRDWLHYNVPTHWVKREWRGTYKGQKQIWFLLRLVGRDCDISLRASGHPEFDAWRWHDYWVPLEAVIEFKRESYRLGLEQLAAFLEVAPRAVGLLALRATSQAFARAAHRCAGVHAWNRRGRRLEAAHRPRHREPDDCRDHHDEDDRGDDHHDDVGNRLVLGRLHENRQAQEQQVEAVEAQQRR